MKKVINARMAVKAEEVEQFLTVSKAVVEASNLEKGCLIYNLYRELGCPTSFIFYEEYENQEALDVHNSSLHFKTFFSQITDLLSEKPQVDVY